LLLGFGGVFKHSMNSSQLYGTMAMIAKQINEKEQKFICVIARGKDGYINVFNGETVDIDDLELAAKRLQDTIKDFKNKSNG
jgi:hypothetical protein